MNIIAFTIHNPKYAYLKHPEEDFFAYQKNDAPLRLKSRGLLQALVFGDAREPPHLERCGFHRFPT